MRSGSIRTTEGKRKPGSNIAECVEILLCYVACLCDSPLVVWTNGSHITLGIDAAPEGM